MLKWGNGRPLGQRGWEMRFESLKSTKVGEYGTSAGSNPAFGTKL